MCGRYEPNGLLSPLVNLTEITLNQFETWFSVEFVKQLNHLKMCGNLGDAIVAKDTMEIFKYLRSHNNNMTLELYTNGSARTPEWFVELANLRVDVVFAIDGLEDTHHLYRINTEWNKIINNAKEFIKAGGRARWDMLVFQHNEHQADTCRELSKQMGFAEFFTKNTNRFTIDKLPVTTSTSSTTSTTSKTVHIIQPTIKSTNMISKVIKAEEQQLPVINCKAKNDNQVYIGADGTVTPCCWLDMTYIRAHHNKTQYLDTIKYWPNLNNQTLEEIFNSGYFDQVEAAWSTTGIKECAKQCGKFDKVMEQFSS
jgi:MoaA/NifB/PqqE/SkfB family radical SAM enzyme